MIRQSATLLLRCMIFGFSSGRRVRLRPVDMGRGDSFSAHLRTYFFFPVHVFPLLSEAGSCIRLSSALCECEDVVRASWKEWMLTRAKTHHEPATIRRHNNRGYCLPWFFFFDIFGQPSSAKLNITTVRGTLQCYNRVSKLCPQFGNVDEKFS